MLRISALFAILFVVEAVLAGRGGKGHGGMGHGGMGGGGMLKWFGLGKEADAVMCKAENLNDDKFDLFRKEMDACHIDECDAQADDISAIQKSENKMVAKMQCSPKYKACMKEKFHKGKGGDDDEEPSEEAMKLWKEKMAAKKECVKAAFEKAFGAIA